MPATEPDRPGDLKARPKPRVVRDLLKITADYLQEKGIDSPRLMAEVLLAHQLNINRVTLYLHLDRPLNESEVSGYRELVRRRVRREPLQYITGVQEFWSLDFTVDQRVLIPRPETEILIEQALKQAGLLPEMNPLKILDLGTGSGVLAVTLAKEIQTARIWATDISPGALSLARVNAAAHGVSERIEFLEGDLWEPLKPLGIVFDLIVSNPPYVDHEELRTLEPEVRVYEPCMALDGGTGGMNYIEKIITGCRNYLAPGGWLLMEMTPFQTGAALDLMAQTAAFANKFRIKDYSHRYRVVCAQTGPG